MTEIFHLEQSNTLFAVQSPSAILATLRSKNRCRRVRTLQSQHLNTEEATTANSSSVAESNQAEEKSVKMSKEATPQSVFGDYFDDEDISSPLKKKKKKTILRRVSRKSQQSQELDKLPLENSSMTTTDKDSSLSDTTPKSKKVKRVTFADQLETYESPRLSKVSSVLTFRAKESPQHKEDDMQLFQKIMLSKFALESLPKISTPENSQNAQFSPMKPPRSRFNAKSDQALGAFANVGKRNSIYNQPTSSLEGNGGDISPTRLPLIISPSNTKISSQETLSTLNSSPRQSLSYRGGSVPFVDLTKVCKFNLSSPANNVPLSERNYNDNYLLKNNSLLRRDLTERDCSNEIRFGTVAPTTSLFSHYQTTNLEGSSLLKLKNRSSVKVVIRKLA